MFDIDLSTSATGFDIELLPSVASGSLFSVKVAGVFSTKLTYVKISNVFIEKPNLVKVDGVFIGGGGGGGGTSPGTANLTAWWALEDVGDSSINARSLSNTGSTPFVAGKVGNAAYTNTGQYLPKGDAAWQQPGTMSICVWFRPDDATPAANQGIIAKWISAGDQRAWAIRQDIAGTTSFVLSTDGINTTDTYSTTTTRSDTTWAFFCVVYIPSTSVTIYLNNESPLVFTTSIPASPADRTGDMTVGRFAATQYFIGLIDEIGFFDDALTSDEVTWLYNSGNGRTFADL